MRKNRIKPSILFACAGVGLFAVLFASLSFGSIYLSPAALWRALAGGEGIEGSILLYSRIPRTLACMLAGAALAASGAILQAVLANKLASPSIIGVNAGAGLGVTVACACGVFAGMGLSLSAFFGSLLAVTVLSLFALRTGASKTTVILGGVALNAMANALSESVAVLDPDIAVLSMDFRVGGFSGVTYAKLIPAAVMILLALLLLLTLCNELDVVALGDGTAEGLGLPIRFYRILFLVLAALLAGAAVSFAGLLGFVGLIVPHFVRRLVGGESRRLLPLSILVGAAFVTLCDLLARTLFLPFEIPVGILMALVGGPIFLWLLLRRKGGARHD